MKAKVTPKDILSTSGYHTGELVMRIAAYYIELQAIKSLTPPNA